MQILKKTFPFSLDGISSKDLLAAEDIKNMDIVFNGKEIYFAIVKCDTRYTLICFKVCHGYYKLVKSFKIDHETTH